MSVARRVLPYALLVLAAVAEAVGAGALGFYLVLATVVAAAVAALDAFGRLVELPGSAAGVATTRAEAFAAATCVGVLVLAAAALG